MMLITTVYTKDGLVGSIYRISTSFTKRGIAQLFRRTELSVPLLEQHPILLAANVSLDFRLFYICVRMSVTVITPFAQVNTYTHSQRYVVLVICISEI